MTQETLRPRGAAADWLLIGGFLAAIAAPLTDQVLGPEGDVQVQAELREPYPRPELAWDRVALEAYPQRFELWYGDAFGLRGSLVRWHNIIKWYGLGVSPTDRLVLGREDWIFHTNHHAIETYRGVDPFDERELVAWQRMLELRRDWLAERGARYLHVVVPNKAEVYPELVPSRFDRLGDSRLDQLVAHMSAHSDVELVDLTPALVADKALDGPGDYSYFRLGIHWTLRGALAGYQEVARRLQRTIPDIEPLDASAFSSEPGLEHGDSWAGRLYMSDLLVQEYRILVPREPLPASSRPFEGGSYREQIWSGLDRNLPTGVLFCDSFGEDWRHYIAQHFWRFQANWQTDFDYALVEERAPDVVLELYSERNLVSATPDLCGPDAQPWVRSRFERSDTVLLDIDVTRNEPALTPIGAARLSTSPHALVLESPTTKLFRVPRFEYPQRDAAILRLDVSAPNPCRLRLLFNTEREVGLSRDEENRTLTAHIQGGRSEVYFYLAAPRIEGRVVFGTDLTRGVPLQVHAIEVRSDDS